MHNVPKQLPYRSFSQLLKTSMHLQQWLHRAQWWTLRAISTPSFFDPNMACGDHCGDARRNTFVVSSSVYGRI
jgi:hypothetical protein